MIEGIVDERLEADTKEGDLTIRMDEEGRTYSTLTDDQQTINMIYDPYEISFFVETKDKETGEVSYDGDGLATIINAIRGAKRQITEPTLVAYFKRMLKYYDFLFGGCTEQEEITTLKQGTTEGNLTIALVEEDRVYSVLDTGEQIIELFYNPKFRSKSDSLTILPGGKTPHDQRKAKTLILNAITEVTENPNVNSGFKETLEPLLAYSSRRYLFRP